MAGTNQGIIEPPIDSLLQKVDSKYQLVIFASKRARQINDYYSDLHEGNLFDNVGPLVEPISFAQSLVGTTGLHLGAVIPVSPVAGIGTWEAGWTAGYALTGLDLATAGTTAVVSHVVVFAFIALIGLLGHVTRRLGRPAFPAGVADVLTGGHAE